MRTTTNGVSSVVDVNLERRAKTYERKKRIRWKKCSFRALTCRRPAGRASEQSLPWLQQSKDHSRSVERYALDHRRRSVRDRAVYFFSASEWKRWSLLVWLLLLMTVGLGSVRPDGVACSSDESGTVLVAVGLVSVQLRSSVERHSTEQMEKNWTFDQQMPLLFSPVLHWWLAMRVVVWTTDHCCVEGISSGWATTKETGFVGRDPSDPMWPHESTVVIVVDVCCASKVHTTKEIDYSSAFDWRNQRCSCDRRSLPTTNTHRLRLRLRLRLRSNPSLQSNTHFDQHITVRRYLHHSSARSLFFSSFFPRQGFLSLGSLPRSRGERKCPRHTISLSGNSWRITSRSHRNWSSGGMLVWLAELMNCRQRHAAVEEKQRRRSILGHVSMRRKERTREEKNPLDRRHTATIDPRESLRMEEGAEHRSRKLKT